MIKITFYILRTSIFLFLNTCAYGQNIYSDSKYHFRIEFPEKWFINQSSLEFTVIKAVNRQDNHISYISIAAYPIPSDQIEYYNNISPERMFNSLLVEENVQQATLINSAIRQVDGRRTLWTQTKVNFPDGITIISSNYHIVFNNLLYRISAVTDGGSDYFEILNPVVERSINTLKFNLIK